MTIKEKIIKICLCDLCGYEWPPKEKEPRVCPRCKRHGWNKEQEKELVRERPSTANSMREDISNLL